MGGSDMNEFQQDAI